MQQNHEDHRKGKKEGPQGGKNVFCLINKQAGKRRTMYLSLSKKKKNCLKACLFPAPSFEISVLVELDLFWVVNTHAEQLQHRTAGQSRGAVRRQQASWSADRLFSTMSLILSDAKAISSKHASSPYRCDHNTSVTDHSKRNLIMASDSYLLCLSSSPNHYPKLLCTGTKQFSTVFPYLSPVFPTHSSLLASTPKVTNKLAKQQQPSPASCWYCTAH